MNKPELIRSPPHIGSGTIIVVAVGVVVLVLLVVGAESGWDAWHIFAVPSMHPHFRDMHAVTDHAECFAKGFDPYFPNACDPLRTPFNYPPPWLWLGYLGIKSSDTLWLSVLMAIAALAVLVALMRGRSIFAGALMSLAIVAPPVLFGVERGNVDLFILTLVGGAALLVTRRGPVPITLSTALLSLAVVLKLYPFFAVALATRFTLRNLIIAAVLALVSVAYFVAIYDIIFIIRHNTPSNIFALSYGYKVPFLGLDELLRRVGRPPTGLSSTWTPITVAILTLVLSAAVALRLFRYGRSDCTVAGNAGGAAFLFGAGIYCGSFMLGANFVYRLVFLLLCMPQVLDWLAGTFPAGNRTPMIARLLLIGILGALWLNAFPIFLAYRIFMAIPQAIDWSLLFGLATVLFLNLLRGVNQPAAR